MRNRDLENSIHRNTAFLRDDSGQTLVVVVLAMGMLLAFMALAFDVGQFLYTRRQLQTAAAAAAMAGALEVQICGTTRNCTAMQTAAKSAIAEQGYATPTLVTQCGTTASTGLILELNNAPCAVSSDPNKGNANYVEALVFMPQPTLLAKLVGLNAVNLYARSEAGGGVSPSCLDVLAPSNTSTTVNSGGAITVSGCRMTVNSNGTPALMVNGSVSAQAVDVAGTVTVNSGGSVTPGAVINAPPVTDPLYKLQSEEPATGPCGTTTSSPYRGAPSNQSVSGTVAFTPGVYCGGINLNNNTTATFAAGTYVFTGTMNVNSGSSITGNGVTFYFSSGTLTMNSASHANLVAPASGTYAGVLMFQNQSDSSASNLDGDSTSVWQGAFYLPDAQLTLNGGSNLAAYTILDVYQLMVNSPFTLNSNYSSLPNGPPIPSSGAALAE